MTTSRIRMGVCEALVATTPVRADRVLAVRVPPADLLAPVEVALVYILALVRLVRLVTWGTLADVEALAVDALLLAAALVRATFAFVNI